MIPDAFLDQGIFLHLWILAIAGFAMLIGGAALAFWARSDGASFTGGTVAVLGIVVVILWVIVLVPFNGRYHHYYAVQGTVTSVSNVLDAADGDLTRTPVVTLDTVNVPLVVDDPRAVELLDRDVTLLCSIRWHHLAADTYECSIREWDAS